jgi:hypothetical protein
LTIFVEAAQAARPKATAIASAKIRSGGNCITAFLSGALEEAKNLTTTLTLYC